MGDPKKTKKHYETPRKPHDKGRLESEREIVKIFGLKNKRELWKLETTLRKKRQNARKLLALPLEERLKREKQLLESLARLGLLSGSSTLDDVLTLSIESILERRLQTMVLRKGLANNMKQARQFIVHGHIAVGEKKVNSPSYLVTVAEEGKISYYGKKMELKPKEAKAATETKKAFEEAAPEKKAVEEPAVEQEEKKGEEKRGQEEPEKKEEPPKKEKLPEGGKKGKNKAAGKKEVEEEVSPNGQ